MAVIPPPYDVPNEFVAYARIYTVFAEIPVAVDVNVPVEKEPDSTVFVAKAIVGFGEKRPLAIFIKEVPKLPPKLVAANITGDGAGADVAPVGGIAILNAGTGVGNAVTGVGNTGAVVGNTGAGADTGVAVGVVVGNTGAVVGNTVAVVKGRVPKDAPPVAGRGTVPPVVANGVGVSALPLGSFPNNFINTLFNSDSPNVSLDFCNLGTVFCT